MRFAVVAANLGRSPIQGLRVIHRRPVAVLLALILTAAHGSAQAAQQRGSLTGGWKSEFLTSPGNPSGVLVLLPGYGSDASELRTASTLIDRLTKSRIAAVVLVPSQPTLFFDEASVKSLDAAVAGLLHSLSQSSRKTVIGGLSAGGTGAVQLAERCAVTSCTLGGQLAGVFAVDSPLDLERIWRGETLTIQRASPQSNTAESKLLLDGIRAVTGGSPGQVPRSFATHSPFTAFSANGGKAASLRKTPVRMYTEPDVSWWIDNRGLDYYAMNSVDAAALVNQLRILGNKDAQLVTTSGRGFRPDGSRHPHSWSIVDQADLARWVAMILQRDDARRG